MTEEIASITFREVDGSGRFRRIRGGAVLFDASIRIEMSASVSVAGSLVRHVEEDVPLALLSEVRSRRPLLQPWRQHIIFVSRKLKAFGTLHAQEGYKLELRSTSTRRQLSGFVREVGIAMASATARSLEDRIESSLSKFGSEPRTEDNG